MLKARDIINLTVNLTHSPTHTSFSLSKRVFFINFAVNPKNYNNYPSAQLNKVDNVKMRVQTIIVSGKKF